jgi:hypothetical protein
MDYEGKPAVDYEINLSLSGKRLNITLRLIREFEPVKVMSVKLPVATVPSHQPGAKMAFPIRSGRLIDLTKAAPMQHVHKVGWFEPAPMGMVYHNQMLALLSLNSLDDQIISKVSEMPNYGTISVEFVRRPRADKPELTFLIQQDSTCSVTILESRNDKPVNWTDGAIAYRDSIPRNIKPMYAGAFIYKIMLDEPDAPDWTTLDDALDLIKRVKRLTGGARQIVYLVGWQHTGHDTGYPDTSVFNKRVGSVDEFKKLVEQAKLENAIVSVHDNFHDAYTNSPAWDAGIIARSSDGELAKGGVWYGGQAYVISPSGYLAGAQARARKTVDMLGIERTVHLDVFSDDPDRIDFNPKSQAGRQKNISAKLAVISTFNQRGIDVTSEVLTSPFVGRISHFWVVENRPGGYWTAEEPIPLVPMMFHGKVTAGGSSHTGQDILSLLLEGWTFSDDFSKSTEDQEIMDKYYLVTLPWTSLASREMSDYEKKGSVERITYNEKTYVEIDRVENTYKIVRDGLTIAADYSTMIPMPDGTIVAYSRNGGKIKIDLPESWTDKDKLKVMQLVASATSSYRFKDGVLTLTTAPRVPYRISYGQK